MKVGQVGLDANAPPVLCGACGIREAWLCTSFPGLCPECGCVAVHVTNNQEMDARAVRAFVENCANQLFVVAHLLRESGRTEDATEIGNVADLLEEKLCLVMMPRLKEEDFVL